MYARSPSGYERVATYQNTEFEESVNYVASRAEWLVTFYGGYAVWKGSAPPAIVRVPCYRDSQVSIVDEAGDRYACAAGGPDGPADTGNAILIWDIAKRAESATFGDIRNMGNVSTATFLDNGRSLAILAWPPSNQPVTTGPENLLLYSLAPRIAKDGVITLPGVSGGWGIYAIGGFAVATGSGSQYRAYCCLRAVAQPVSRTTQPLSGG